jgi:nucleotide-binding universal stress UspA family protein
MYKKILVPLDSSELSECSLQNVKEVAAGNKATEVILLGVVEPIPADVSAYMKPSFIIEVLQNAERTFKDYLDGIAGVLGKDGVSAQSVVVHGKAAEEILYYAAKHNIDLIIMSTHGKSGIKRWAVGSVADRVLRHSGIPVLLSSPSACRV